MTDVEIAVSFFALLGGLLLANVANNMADALRARRDLPIGIVPWAINFYISAAVISTFALFSEADQTFSFDVIQLTALLVALMPYIMVSRLLYPEHEERWASVEDYYIANRKLILGLMLIPAVSYALSLTYYTPELVAMGPILIFNSLPTIATLVAMIFVDKPQWHWVGWGFLILHRFALMIWLAVATA